jgi:uncharacterized protein YdeI (YjbR/CyaY-like superfamily)
MDSKPAAGPPISFESAARFRRWLEKNHGEAKELVLGFHRKAAGQAALTYHEALDEALCFGWIDGVRRSVGDGRWTVRFSPRKPKSIWSLVNIRHVERLKREGRMAAPGLRALDGRNRARSGLYSFEQRKTAAFDPAATRAFRRDAAAWAFWTAQPPGYRRTATFWVTSAKKPETRLRRLLQLIGDSSHRRRLGLLTRPRKTPPESRKTS